MREDDFSGIHLLPILGQRTGFTIPNSDFVGHIFSLSKLGAGFDLLCRYWDVQGGGLCLFELWSWAGEQETSNQDLGSSALDLCHSLRPGSHFHRDKPSLRPLSLSLCSENPMNKPKIYFFSRFLVVLLFWLHTHCRLPQVMFAMSLLLVGAPQVIKAQIINHRDNSTPLYCHDWWYRFKSPGV